MRYFALSYIPACIWTALVVITGALLGVFATACATPVSPAPSSAPPTVPPSAVPAGAFKIASNVFSEGGAIPKKYACDGENISPPLQWVGAPSGAKSFVLIMDDPDAPGGTFTHWVAFDLPGTQTEILERAPSVGKGAKNSRGQNGYTGPCPPSGTHRYFFTLDALDIPSLGLQEGASRADVEKAMSGHILASTQTMGRYGR
ncbi:MAG: YbhB/YbcL family Raf kinase inhibitor-like protein [Acidobacteriota bacterium]